MKETATTSKGINNVIDSNVIVAGSLKKVDEDWLKEILEYRWNSIAMAPEAEINTKSSAKKYHVTYTDPETGEACIEIEVNKSNMKIGFSNNVAPYLNVSEQEEFASTLGEVLTEFFNDPNCYKN